MSLLQEPSKCLLFSSFLFQKQQHTKNDLINWFESEFGKSIIMNANFIHSQEFLPIKKYYSKEMGEESGFDRVFILGLLPKERRVLIDSKIMATAKENETLLNNARTVNIDMGIITLENFQLATGKNFSHRVYLEQGVYSDLTLLYKGDSYSSLEWTYPDYQHSDMISFLNWARQLLMCQL